MKKVLIIAMLIVAILIPVGASAENVTHSSVDVIFTADDIPGAVEGDVLFKIYDINGILLNTQTYNYKRGTGWFNIRFNVPEYKAGTKFRVQLASGGANLVHCDNWNSVQEVETYAYLDANGKKLYQTAFYMKFIPVWYKQATIRFEGKEKTDYYHCVMSDDVYVTVDLLSEMGINLEYNPSNEKPGFKLSTYSNKKEMKFYIDDIYVLKGGKGENLKRPVFKIGDLPYVPLSVVTKYFECDYKVLSNNEYSCEIAVGESKYSEAYEKAKYVNEQGITSRTEYLVWISKKDFTVSLFKGSQGKWRWVKSMPCAIGAPSTPTIEGSFELIERKDRWCYDSYYCGPIMRFKNGYALHSTLIRYDGTPYDSRVGVKISHGCVRLRPEDINWLFNITPMYSRIWVTA